MRSQFAGTINFAVLVDAGVFHLVGLELGNAGLERGDFTFEEFANRGDDFSTEGCAVKFCHWFVPITLAGCR